MYNMGLLSGWDEDEKENKIAALEQRVEELENALLYAPHGLMAQQAKKHFESLI